MIPEDFFTVDLELKKYQIMSFVLFVFEDFERSLIVKYGICDNKDLIRFQMQSLKVISDFKVKNNQKI
ncbi:hypothetical protein HNQ03_002755 [Chryseobacterium sp. 16F]|uniref:Uncharacterized protein n=1 Tax=Frigoriflavimonas asaccharolytica TaxID=2735899 RepID=A0A8J8KCI2_9FLAO|nr:hypothetical protein [Frigoriflavimonas asaccharolytica]